MKIRRSTAIPTALFVYLCIMAYIGLPELHAGNTLYYFSIIGITLACIVALHFAMKKREKLARERREDIERGKRSD